MSNSPGKLKRGFKGASYGMSQSDSDHVAEQVARGIFDAHGNLINDPQLQIILAAMNIEIPEL